MSNNSAVTVDGGEIGRAQAMQARAAGLAPQHPVQPDPAQTRQRPHLAAGGAGPRRRHRRRQGLLHPPGPAGRPSSPTNYLAANRIRRRHLRGRRLSCRDQPAGNRSGQHGAGPRGEPARHTRRRHRPRRAAGPSVRHRRGARTRRPATDLRVRGQQVSRGPRPAGARAHAARGADRQAHLRRHPVRRRAVARRRGLPVGASPTAWWAFPQPPRGANWLRVAAVRLPRISNSTDIEALACEPGVLVRWVSDPADLADADVVVIPGSKATVADLSWLRERGLADGVKAHAAHGQAGARHLRRLPDAVPAHRRPGGIQGRSASTGLGLLDADIVFAPDKTLRASRAPAARLRNSPRPARARRPKTTGSASASGAAASTAPTGMGCWTTTTFAEGG